MSNTRESLASSGSLLEYDDTEVVSDHEERPGSKSTAACKSVFVRVSVFGGGGRDQAGCT